MQTLKKGDKSEQVKELQKALNKIGYGLVVDGDFGSKTEYALTHYQQQNKLTVTGQCDEVLFKKITQSQPSKSPLILEGIEPCLLPPNEYKQGLTKKRGIAYHHTAGSGDPYAVKSSWDGDDRGRVATEYGVGGWGKHDGKPLQYIPFDGYAHHIMTTRMGFSESHNLTINQSYIGIEICNWGYLTEKNGKFYTYTGLEIPIEQVCVLEKPFRKFKYWHKYTDKQLATVENLTIQLAKHYKLKLEKPFERIDESWFELSWDALNMNRTLTTHTNFEAGKWDCFPQPEFLQMLERVYERAKTELK